MRDKFFEFRPAATDPGELPTEDRHRPGDPDRELLDSGKFERWLAEM